MPAITLPYCAAAMRLQDYRLKHRLTHRFRLLSCGAKLAAGDVSRARDALATWRTELSASANLDRALAEQSSAKALNRAI